MAGTSPAMTAVGIFGDWYKGRAIGIGESPRPPVGYGRIAGKRDGGRPMSQLEITKYLNELSDLKKVSGSTRESVVREAFKDLLKAMGRARDLVFISEHHIVTPAKTDIFVDGARLYDLRLPFGYWEAKDKKTSSTRKSPGNSSRAIPRTTSFSRTASPPSSSRTSTK
jgi:hypothetical protein